jgi:hypothetical protein
MQCPKCGREVSLGAFICPGCEFILDTSFLGEDITDDDKDKRMSGPSFSKPGKRTTSGEFGEDAIILGDGQGEYSDFSSRDAGGLTREVTQARFYIGGATAALLHPDAVPEVVPGIADTSIKMSPFEMHVIGFINGKRSIGRIHKKSAMEDSEFKVAVSMLADKGVIRLRTTKKRKKNKSDGLLSRSESSRSMAAAPPPEGSERTVVAPIQIPANDVEEEWKPQRADVRGSRASNAEATIIRSSEASKKSKLPGFASMRVQEGEEKDEVVEQRADAWGDEQNPNNISNVFARVPPKGNNSGIVRPSFADSPQTDGLPADVSEQAQSFEDGGDGIGPDGETDMPDDVNEELLPPGLGDDFKFDKSQITGAKKALAFDDEDDVDAPLKHPTALGDIEPARDDAAVAGDAFDDDALDDEGARADDEEVIATDDRKRPPTSITARGTSDLPTGPLPEAEAELYEGHREEEEEDADDDRLDDRFDDESEREIEQERDDGPPALPDDAGDDDDGGFDVDINTSAATKGITSANTASLPSVKPPVLELPSDAMKPLPSKVMASPAMTPSTAPEKPPPARWEEPKKQVIGLPGQALPSLAKPSAPLGLPGQSLQKPSGGQAKPTGATGAARPSAQSKVPFEQARKAEKIFEQASKDLAEGRLSSARMNAKLCVMYDPTVPAYAEFLKELDAKGGDAKLPVTHKSRELQLFEAASEAEGKGDFDKAVSFLEEAVSINPKAAALRNRLGVVLSIRLKRHTEALEQLKLAIDLEPGNIVYMNNFSKVTALLDSQLEKDPNEKKKKGKINEKVEIKKMRPKLF